MSWEEKPRYHGLGLLGLVKFRLFFFDVVIAHIFSYGHSLKASIISATIRILSLIISTEGRCLAIEIPAKFGFVNWDSTPIFFYRRIIGNYLSQTLRKEVYIKSSNESEKVRGRKKEKENAENNTSDFEDNTLFHMVQFTFI